MGTVLLATALAAIGMKPLIDRAEFHIASAASPLALNDDGVTWTKIPNMVGNLLNNFTIAGGTLTKTVRSLNMLVNGVSDVSANKASTVYYGLAINGAVVSSEITKHAFSAAAKTENISITALALISIDDEIEIWAKGDGTLSLEITINKLDVTFVGES